MFFQRKAGVSLILLALLVALPDNSQGQDTSLNISTLRDLGIKFMQKGEYQLSYFYNYSYYLLSADMQKKKEAVLDAVDACLLTGHYPEAEKVIFDAENFGSGFSDQLKMKYGYSLVMQREFTRADIYLGKIEDPGRFPNQYHFLKAYTTINSNSTSECLENLKKIDSSFPDYAEVSNIIGVLNADKKFKKKHLALSLPMSALLPGLGQAYSGFYFDALQSFGLNAAFGVGAYSAWKYELTKNKTDRNYVLPGVSTLIFSIFYITNLYNTANVTQKANLFSESEYYRKIADRFDIVLNNNSYFIRLKIRM
jgi:hypothetical protein